MKFNIVYIIIVLGLLLLIADIKLTLSPFSFKLRNPWELVGVVLVIVGMNLWLNSLERQAYLKGVMILSSLFNRR